MTDLNENLDMKKESENALYNILPALKGNPGALQVVMKIAETDPMFLNPLGIAIFMTRTNASAIWIVYKNICDQNIDKTKTILSDWFENSILNLEEWCKSKRYI